MFDFDLAKLLEELTKSPLIKNVATLVVLLIVVGGLAMYWDVISQSTIYKNYFAWMIDPLLKMAGIQPAQPPAPAP